MLLAIDIGNTNIVLGVFKGDRLLQHWRLSTNPYRTADEYGSLIKGLFSSSKIKAEGIDGVAVSCVVPPLLTVFEEVVLRYFNSAPLIVSTDIDTGLKIRYDNPKEIGADRIVNAVAAFHLYGGPVIIVDFGTATTFCAVTAEGEYLGGVIAPGVAISAEALFQRAAKLPKVELSRPKSIMGRDTVSAMQSGIIFGYASLVDGIIERMKDELGIEPHVIATGGLAGLIAPETKTIKDIRPSLTLEGLKILYKRNKG